MTESKESKGITVQLVTGVMGLLSDDSYSGLGVKPVPVSLKAGATVGDLLENGVAKGMALDKGPGIFECDVHMNYDYCAPLPPSAALKDGATYYVNGPDDYGNFLVSHGAFTVPVIFRLSLTIPAEKAAEYKKVCVVLTNSSGVYRNQQVTPTQPHTEVVEYDGKSGTVEFKREIAMRWQQSDFGCHVFAGDFASLPLDKQGIFVDIGEGPSAYLKVSQLLSAAGGKLTVPCIADDKKETGFAVNVLSVRLGSCGRGLEEKCESIAQLEAGPAFKKWQQAFLAGAEHLVSQRRAQLKGLEAKDEKFVKALAYEVVPTLVLKLKGTKLDKKGMSGTQPYLVIEGSMETAADEPEWKHPATKPLKTTTEPDFPEVRIKLPRYFPALGDRARLRDARIQITVMDKNLIAADELVGEAKCSLGKILDQKEPVDIVLVNKSKLFKGKGAPMAAMGQAMGDFGQEAAGFLTAMAPELASGGVLRVESAKIEEGPPTPNMEVAKMLAKIVEQQEASLKKFATAVAAGEARFIGELMRAKAAERVATGSFKAEVAYVMHITHRDKAATMVGCSHTLEKELLLAGNTEAIHFWVAGYDKKDEAKGAGFFEMPYPKENLTAFTSTSNLELDVKAHNPVKAESKTAAVDCMRHVVGGFQERAKKDNGTRFLYLVFAYEPDSADEGKAFAGPLCDYVKELATSGASNLAFIFAAGNSHSKPLAKDVEAAAGALVIPYATYSNAGFCLKPMDAFVEAARKAKLAA